ncbi:hypothetical protein ACSJL1_002598 [Serratia sarumanii]
MFTPLTLPNGSRLSNRLAKAAMEENLAAPGQLPGPALWRLYRYWAEGGAGLIITGNVMIDGRAMTGPAAWCWNRTRRSPRSKPGPRPRARAARRCGCSLTTRAGR